MENKDSSSGTKRGTENTEEDESRRGKKKRTRVSSI